MTTHAHRQTNKRTYQNTKKKQSKQKKKSTKKITASTINTSAATEMETFKNLKIVRSVHRLYAS